MTETFFIAQPIATGKKSKKTKDMPAFRLYRSGALTLKWSNEKEPPAIGQEITITMNGIGPAIVKGYFASEDFLGVMTLATNPPKWLREQRERDRKDVRNKLRPGWWLEGIGCEFGAEIEY